MYTFMTDLGNAHHSITKPAARHPPGGGQQAATFPSGPDDDRMVTVGACQ
jgi:hypothetical protein